MPRISFFYGISIYMYFADHNPPHFHAPYGRAKALISIETGEPIAGNLPRTAKRLIKEWAWRIRPSCARIGRAPKLRAIWKGYRVPMAQADFPMVDVLRVRALDGRRLALSFSDGLGGVYDCAPLFEKNGTMVQPLKDAVYFARVFIEAGAPTWPNGFDLDPIALYMQLRDAGKLRPAEVAAE